MAEDSIKTLVVDNFHGSMTTYVNGDINSGLTNVIEVFGYNPFGSPGSLTWYEDPQQIDAPGAVVTDLILAGKPRVESGILYMYTIGHTGRVYKIQVNDPATYNPNYDNPVLLTTLTVGTPTFTRGASIDFYGATEKMYIGHDKGVTSLNFDGSGEAAVGLLASWTQNVPRPLQQFVGKLYIGNGTNVAELDTTAIITTYTKLSPGFPTGSQVRDLDVTPDGTYLQSIVAELPLGDVTSGATATAIISPADSFVFLWNGTDIGYTSFTTYSGSTLSAATIFGDSSYNFGYDSTAGGAWNPIRKLLTSTPYSAYGESPSPNAIFGTSNLVYAATPLPFNDHLEMIIIMKGTLSDYEFKEGYWCPFGQAATAPETDIARIPFCAPVSNFAKGTSYNGYPNNIFGEPKVYFSTLETSSTTTKYRLYKWSIAPSGLGDAFLGGVYQTQTQLFSKKVRLSEVRVYGEPWQTGASFTVDLIGSDNNPISGASKTFTVGGNMTAGADYAYYTPQSAPTYAIGLRITNEGATNHVISKVEIDYAAGGK